MSTQMLDDERAAMLCVMCDAPTSHRDGWCEKCRGDPDKSHRSRKRRFKRLSKRPLPVCVGEGGRIAEPLPCPECEYNLQTLPSDSNCPECGNEIQAMLAKRPLSLASASWLGSMKGGAVMMLVGAGLYAATLMFMTVGMFMIVLAIFSLAMIPLSVCLFIIGMLRLTRAEPDAPPGAPGETAARWASRAIILNIVLAFSFFSFSVGMMFAGRTGQLPWFFIGVPLYSLCVALYLFALNLIAYRIDALNSRLPKNSPTLGSGLLWKAMIPANVLILLVWTAGLLAGFNQVEDSPAVLVLWVILSIFTLGYLAIVAWLIAVTAHRALIFRRAERIARDRVQQALSAIEAESQPAAG